MSTSWYKSRHIPRRVFRAYWPKGTTTKYATTKSAATSDSGSELEEHDVNVINDNDKIEWKQTVRIRPSVEIWDTTCIVTNLASPSSWEQSSLTTASAASSTTQTIQSSSSSSSSSSFQILVNPANPTLSGVSQFPYFPKGGPLPQRLPSKDSHPIMGYVTQWGGMEVGDGMFFATNTVDGLVHQLGGPKLQQDCHKQRLQRLQTIESNSNATTVSTTSSSSSSLSSSFKSSLLSLLPSSLHSTINTTEDDRRHRLDEVALVPEGQAVSTPAVGQFVNQTSYRHIVHTIPPFYNIHNNQVMKPKPTKVNGNKGNSDSNNSVSGEGNNMKNNSDINNKNNDDEDNISNNNDDKNNNRIQFTTTSNDLLLDAYHNAFQVALKDIIIPQMQQQQQEQLQQPPSSSSLEEEDDGTTNRNTMTTTKTIRIATPLLGAGCRGFPINDAIHVAARSAMEWLMMMTTMTTMDSSSSSRSVNDDIDDINADDDDGNDDEAIFYKNGICKDGNGDIKNVCTVHFSNDQNVDDDDQNDDDHCHDESVVVDVVVAFGIPSNDIRDRLERAIRDLIDPQR